MENRQCMCYYLIAITLTVSGRSGVGMSHRHKLKCCSIGQASQGASQGTL